MRAASVADLGAPGWDALTHGLADESPMVRLEAVHGITARMKDETCGLLVAALKDRDTHVDLAAIDGLARCGASDDAVAALVRTANDLSQADSPRGWHRSAHAIVALAAAAPDRASAALGHFTGSSIWQLRLYAARAAELLKETAALEKLARDGNDNVVEAAIDGLSKVAGHSRRCAVCRSAVANRLSGDSRRCSRAQRIAFSDDRCSGARGGPGRGSRPKGTTIHTTRAMPSPQALATLGAPARAKKARQEPAEIDISPDDVRRLAAPRARVTIRGIGTFELALVGGEAPASVIRFAKLAESGYYNGLTFHRVVPNFVVQGGSPGANEYVGDAMFMRDEVGLWPHVRGAVGISTRGRDTGDAQLFIDLVDNPRLDHDYTVFAQVLNGMDVVDQILEGDIIDAIEIVAVAVSRCGARSVLHPFRRRPDAESPLVGARAAERGRNPVSRPHAVESDARRVRVPRRPAGAARRHRERCCTSRVPLGTSRARERGRVGVRAPRASIFRPIASC